MTTAIDKTYRKEKLLDWERKGLIDKFSDFSFSKKSTWKMLGLIILIICAFGFIAPIIPPRYGWSNWTPPTTSDEYLSRLTIFLLTTPLLMIAIFISINIGNKVDLFFGTKRIANFRVTGVLDLMTIKILCLNGWRLFSIREKQQYFNSTKKGQVITIKRTATFRLLDYYIRDEKVFYHEQERNKASH